MEQKVVITDSGYDIGIYLDKGWKVISITAQHVATSNNYELRGKFCFLLEREVK